MSGLLFIRHAETDMAGTFCGHSDPSVNARGKLQILNLVAHLKHEEIDEVYCSDLLRAVSTAESVAQGLAAPVIKRPGLREIYFGDWEGLTWTEIEQLDPAYANRWIEEFPGLPAPRGESFADFQARVVDEMRHLFLLAEKRKIAVVTHGGVMRVVLRELYGSSDQEAWEQTNSYCCSFVVDLRPLPTRTLRITLEETLIPAPHTGD
jgi:alpha-ribazole phosphatase/probable phosphoglycerate mutase